MADKVYELRFYKFNMQGKIEFKEMLSDGESWKLRTDMSPVPGIWETQINGCSEIFHIAEYDDLAHLLRVRGDMAKNTEFCARIKSTLDTCGTFENCLAFLVPETTFCTQFVPSPHPVYELQTMKNTNGSCPSLDHNATLIGRFVVLYGPASTEYRLIRYSDSQMAQKAAISRVLFGGDQNILETRLMVPLAVSGLQ